jgi:hypothetical protein
MPKVPKMPKIQEIASLCLFIFKDRSIRSFEPETLGKQNSTILVAIVAQRAGLFSSYPQF